MRSPLVTLARRRSAGGHTAALVAIAAALTWLYAGVMRDLAQQWASDENYAHGFLVLPLAGFVVWERRRQLVATPAQPSNIGLAALAFSLLCYVAGQLGAELFLTRVSLIGILASLVLFFYGRQHLRLLAFPLGFLLLMVPLPTILFNVVAAPLQTLAAQLGEAAIAVSGVPVLREGNILMVPGRALEVAEACSGIRSLMSLLTLALALGYFTEPRNRVRVLLAVSAIPIAVALNAARVAGTGLATYWISPAAADGFFHTFSGWLMFIAATILLMLAQQLCAMTRVPVRAGAVSC